MFQENNQQQRKLRKYITAGQTQVKNKNEVKDKPTCS
jgi:hypothetical protein